jgi:hypothetical protein
VTVSEHQLAFDLDALNRLVGQLHDRRRVGTGPERLLVELVRQGLDEDALIPAAGLALALDQPKERT